MTKRVQVTLINGKEYTFKPEEAHGLSEIGYGFKTRNGTKYFFPMSAILIVMEYDAVESED